MADTTQDPPNEPIVEDMPNADTGLTAVEQAQFDSMRKADSGDTLVPPTPAPVPVPAVAPAEKASPSKDATPPASTDTPEGEDDADDGDADIAVAGATPPVPGQEPAKQPPRRVSFGKFQRMEKKAKALEKERDAERAEKQQLRETQARLDERLNLINEALTTPSQAKKAAEEDPEPHPEEDIFGHVAWQKRQIERLGGTIQQMQQGQQEQTADQRLVQAYTDDARSFFQQEPHFTAAYEFLMASRVAELAQYYYQIDLLSPDAPNINQEQLQKIRNTIGSEEKELVAGAIKNRQSPAKAIYNLARARGYRPEPAVQANTGAKSGNGAAVSAGKDTAAPADTTKTPVTMNVQDEIARVREGQAGALTLSGGGAAPLNTLTPARLVDMSQEDFNAMMDGLTEAQQRKVMGG